MLHAKKLLKQAGASRSYLNKIKVAPFYGPWCMLIGHNVHHSTILPF